MRGEAKLTTLGLILTVAAVALLAMPRSSSSFKPRQVPRFIVLRSSGPPLSPGGAPRNSLDPTISNPNSIGSTYLKWDEKAMRMSSDEKEVDDFNIPGGPRVTKLEQPSSVSWGQDGTIYVHSKKDPGVVVGEVDQKSMNNSSTVTTATASPPNKKRLADSALGRDKFNYDRWDRIADGISDTFYSGDDAELEWKKEDEEERRMLAEERERARERWLAANRTGITNTSLEEEMSRFRDLDIEEMRFRNKSFHAREEALTMAYMTRNGAHREKYMWRQDWREVEVFLKLPDNTTKHHEVVVALQEVVHQYPHVGFQYFLNVTIGGKLFFKREIAFKILRDKTFDGGLMWSLQSYDGEGGKYPQMRLLQVVWIKERRFHHIAKHWWNAAFKGEPSINVEYIMDRADQKGVKNFTTVWEEAHKLFKEKIKHKKKIPISLSSDDYEKAKKYEKEINERRRANRKWGLPGVEEDEEWMKPLRAPTKPLKSKELIPRMSTTDSASDYYDNNLE